MIKVVVTAGAMRHAKLQSSRHHQQTNTQQHIITDVNSATKMLKVTHRWVFKVCKYSVTAVLQT